MRTPVTIRDHLERAELVYGDRVGIVDEPDQPGGVARARSPTAQCGELARAQAAGLDALGIGAGERVAIVSHNSARLLTSFFGVSGYGPGARADQLPPQRRRDRVHRRALAARRCCSSTPSSTRPSPTASAQAPVRARRGRRRRALRSTAVEPEPWASPTRTPPRTINYTTGTTARPKGVQLTHRNLWLNAATFGWHTGVSATATSTCTRCRCSTATAGACRTRSPAWAAARRAAQGRRRRDPAPRRRARRHAAVRRARGRRRGPRRRRDVGRPDPRPGRTRIVVAGAPPPTRTIERVETELGWEFIQIYGLTETSPLLTMNRSRAGVGRPRRRRSGRQLLGRAGAPALGVRIAGRRPRARCSPAATYVLEGYWEQPEATADAHRRRLVPHRRRRRSSTTSTTSRSPTARRT